MQLLFSIRQDHLDYFYKMKPEAVPMKLTGMDKVIDNYNELRDQLGCKDLKWYLENVDHEMVPWWDPWSCLGA